MDQEILIRNAGPADLPAIHLLAHQVWPVTYGALLAPEQLEYMLELIYNPAALEKQMQAGQHFLIAERAAAAVGFASFAATAQPQVYKLQKLYVTVAVQGQGLGKQLIEAVIQRVQPLGATHIRLNVNRQNKAISFYESYGFQIVSEEDIDIGQGYFMNDFVMEKDV
ncbi:MAG: GNAT family N-acetyltransferase [Chitinophagaceae bacterium]